MKNIWLRKKSGFTLVEMMVAVSIFVIVALIISGAYITLANIFRKVQTNRAVIDNINFAMDTMTLQIREGQNYFFEDSCGSTCFESITFDELVVIAGQQQPARRIKYTRRDLGEDNQRIVQCTADYDSNGNLINSLPTDLDDCPELTSREIVINHLRFYNKNSIPERILLTIDGVAKNKEGFESEFTLQTTLAQRNF